jgi:hypothetical protein
MLRLDVGIGDGGIELDPIPNPVQFRANQRVEGRNWRVEACVELNTGWNLVDFQFQIL